MIGMKSNKRIVIIFIIIDLIILLSFVFFRKNEDNKKVEKNNKAIINKDESLDEVEDKDIVDKSNDNNVKEEVKEEVNKSNQDNNISNQENNNSNSSNNIDNNSGNNNSANNNSNSGTSSSSVSQPDSAPVVTYSCLNGYTLNGTICISIIDADYVCPVGLVSYSNSDISDDIYCINFSEASLAEGDSCPGGYGIVKQITFGGPDVYQCFPLHERVYVCPNDYTLKNTKCIKEIGATMN